MSDVLFAFAEKSTITLCPLVTSIHISVATAFVDGFL